MSTQRYTRWRTVDDDYDEDVDENGELTEPRDEEESESRRAFTMMTPARDSIDANMSIFSKKFVLIAGLVCTFCVLGGAFVGFYIGFNHEVDQTPPWHPDLMPTPEVKPTPAPSRLHVDDTKKFEDIPAMSMRLINHLNIYNINSHIRNLTSKKPKDISSYIKSTLRKLGYTIKPLVYSVATSYPERDIPSTVSIGYKNGTIFVVSNSFRTDRNNKSFVSFNGYSANGTFTGRVVNGHFATEKDLMTIQANNVTLNNTILIVRQGKLHPAIQVRNAEKFGVKAVLLYPDPTDFGGKVDPRKPNKWSLPEDGVITQSLRTATGDPATVGYTSEKSAYRLPSSKFTDIPHIPVQSISASEARLIFEILDGPIAPNAWKGDVSANNSLGGDFKSKFKISNVTVAVFCDVGATDVRSIHAYLPAEDNTKVIHVGTHYDETGDRISVSAVSIAAWLSFAGALKEAFPNGTYRMVMFNAFPGTQGDYSGGGEFAELLSNWIHSTALAYIDFDEILKGNGFLAAQASPLLREVLKESYHHVQWPYTYNTSVFLGLLDVKQQLENDSHLEFDDLHEIKEPSMCGENTNFYAKHGIPTLNLASVYADQHDFYYRNTQYDVLHTAIDTLDMDAHWTLMITSLLSICTIILSNTAVPPVDFEYYARNLKNDWYKFKYEQIVHATTFTKDINEIIDTLSGEFDILPTVFDELTLWYKDESTSTLTKTYRKREASLLQFLMLSRQFLRPPSVPSPMGGGTSLLTFGPDVEDSCKGVSFPMARKVLYDIQKNMTTWDQYEKELSLILSAVSSLNTKIGSHR